MKISKSSPLNKLYAYWVRLGGKPTYSKYADVTDRLDRPIADESSDYKDNLCHFMRVCLIWVWFRWLFCRRWWGSVFISPFIVLLIAVGVALLSTIMIVNPLVRWIVITVALALGGLVLFMWLTQDTAWGKAQHRRAEDRAVVRHERWKKRLEPWADSFEVFKAWIYAKKMRVCPTIEIER